MPRRRPPEVACCSPSGRSGWQRCRHGWRPGGVSFRKVPLWRLRADGIEDIVRGLSRTARIQRRWGATVDPDLPRVIRDDLLSDPESPVAPTLQIVMTRLFEEADRRSPGKPALTKALYDELRRRGLLFKDFVPQQVRLVAERQREHVESGLADDLLEHHTTASETAAEHPIEALKKRYGHIGPNEETGARLVEALVEELKAAKLLSEGALRSPEEARPHEPAEAGDERTSLAHDTLAPLVRARFAGSGLPGQRARRLLEARAVEWRDGAEGRTLDDGDLALVRRGLRGMRAVTTDERRLLDASETAAQARKEAARAQEEAARAQEEAKRASDEEAKKSRESARKARRNLGLGALVLAAAVIVGGVVLYYQDQQTIREEAGRKRAEAMADVEQLLTRADKAVSPGEALPLLCRAVDVLPPDDPRLDRIVARAVQTAAEAPVVSVDLNGFLAASGGTTAVHRVVRAEVSAGGARVLVTLTDGSMWVVPVDAGALESGGFLGQPRKLDSPVMNDIGPGLSPDGRWVGEILLDVDLAPDTAAGEPARIVASAVLLWELEASPAPRWTRALGDARRSFSRTGPTTAGRSGAPMWGCSWVTACWRARRSRSTTAPGRPRRSRPQRRPPRSGRSARHDRSRAIRPSRPTAPTSPACGRQGRSASAASTSSGSRPSTGRARPRRGRPASRRSTTSGAPA